MAKTLIAGYAKTRLIPKLGEAGALKLYQQLLTYTIDMACENQLCPVELWTKPTSNHPLFNAFEKQYPITLKEQVGKNLGETLAHAIESSLIPGQPLVIIGTDSMALTQQHLQEAITQLLSGKEVVVAPAEDGGFVLLGLQKFNPELFADIVWGSSSVLATLRKNIKRLQWTSHELETLWDVDRPEDLERASTVGANLFAKTSTFSRTSSLLHNKPL